MSEGGHRPYSATDKEHGSTLTVGGEPTAAEEKVEEIRLRLEAQKAMEERMRDKGLSGKESKDKGTVF